MLPNELKANERIFAYSRGEIIPVEKASLHVSDLSIQRGYGVFDYFKIKEGHPFFMDDYLARFFQSASLMRLEVQESQKKLKNIIYRLIDKNQLDESGMKLILTGGYSADGYHPAGPNLIITQHPLSFPSPEQLEKGIKIIMHEYVREIPLAKTINYTMGIWLIEKIAASNATDVLYHQQGVVSEFPRCNFFIVRDDNTVITPAGHVLGGITRKNLLKLSGHPFKVEEGIVTLDDIRHASEAFLTSTTKRIVPIVQVDDIVIGQGRPGPVSRSLLDALISLESEDRRANSLPQKFYRF